MKIFHAVLWPVSLLICCFIATPKVRAVELFAIENLLPSLGGATGKDNLFTQIDVQDFIARHPDLFHQRYGQQQCTPLPQRSLPQRCRYECTDLQLPGSCPVCTIRCDLGSSPASCPAVQLQRVGSGCYNDCSLDASGCTVCRESCYDLGPTPAPYTPPSSSIYPGHTCDRAPTHPLPLGCYYSCTNLDSICPTCTMHCDVPPVHRRNMFWDDWK